MPERGEFIVLEGADFSGKTTQINLLKEAWKDRDDILFTREPGGTPYGEAMRQLLFFPPEDVSPMIELMLLTSGRLHSVETQIEPALSAGINVVTDRSWYSSLGYQGGGGGIPLEDITEITARFLPDWYMFPEKTVVLTVPTDERLYRKAQRDLQDGKLDTFEKQDHEYFDRVNHIYEDHVIGKLGAKGISGVGDPLAIHENIVNFVG